MSTKTHLNLLLLTAGLMAAAPGVADTVSSHSPRTPSAAGATVSFTNLPDGAVVAPVFTVQFGVSGMAIAPAGSQIEFSGHHHLLIDVAELPDLNQPLPATDHIRHFGQGQTEVELSLPEGVHALQLLLADYAHIPHEPPVLSEKIYVTVAATTAPQPKVD